ncbi:hypothetical protein B9Z55_020923 [Caenorhabditis nigoni]|uniref:NR LBD domain-containing protein n=1 Tax=Caenorhabditis nigoni TaxID=1611254 RepID=A0A2G5TPQ2_9PELO|nr:hypothetical protein B9Z55_020923 [Caenorhabditis nigoni]
MPQFSAIQQRDRLGPRNPKPILPIFSESETWVDVSNPTSGSPSANHFLNHLIHLQQNQRSRHKKLHKNYSNPPIGDKKNHATPADINLTVKLGMKDADEWGKQFEAYRVLNQKEKKSVLSEYGILFLLIDLGFKTSQEADDEGHWLLQNGKTLEVAVSSKNPSVNHFVSELINTISIPFQTLKIDDFECAVLKALLLLNCEYN